MSHFIARPHALLALALLSAACSDDAPSTEDREDGSVVDDDGGRADGGGGDIDEEDAEQNSEDGGDADAGEPCTGSECVAPTCDDLTLNGDETGVDCGGSCGSCEDDCEDPTGAACAPEAGFTLSAGGEAPITVSATSSATRGTTPITQVLYDWGDGTGTGPDTDHRYFAGGAYTVQQRVIDAAGRSDTATQQIAITGFTPVRMSSTDQSAGSSQENGSPVPHIVLTDDGRTVEVLGMDEAGVRSDTAITPGSSRVFYFEGERLFANTADFWGFGVGTNDAPLAGALGSTADSFGVFTQGSVTTDFYTCAGTLPMAYVSVPGARDEGGEHFGFVVDYRAAHPAVYLIAHNNVGVPAVICSTTLTTISKPLFIQYGGRRATVGPQGRVNTGSDTANHPFYYTPAQIESALTVANAAEVVPNLTYGFTRTRALPASDAPVLTPSANVSVALGSPVTLTATATDTEDGDLTARIAWADRSSSFSHAILGTGASFSFTPVGIGAHHVAVSVTDSVGRRTQATVVVNVTGTLPSFPTVRFVEENRGERTFVTADGLSVYFGPSGHFKDAVRVNQGLKGNFWYFEATRPPLVAPDTAVRGFGIGLIVGDAPLNPYSIYEVPWSMSINTSSGVWKALVNVGNLSAGSASPGNEAAITPTLDRYGFAVDYRGEHPRVHVLVGSGATARFIKTVRLDDIDVPVYPYVYSGDGQDGTSARPAVTLNFGTPQFTNVRAALATPSNPDTEALAAPDVAALVLGWHAP